MTAVTIIGNLTAPPELKFTPQGKAVVSFTVAESKRVKGADGNWTDGDSTFWRCSLWDTAAENMAESLDKGQRVIVVGEVKQRTFETREGEKRTVMEVTATEVGPSLKWALCKPEKTGNKGGGFTAKKSEPADDPWSAATDNGDGFDASEPPF
jgi:single-strand DNA-binding protein